jgi:D-beta-D-heptose 7-phosphate kinase/D-beta-D-heptose 1-phosphate adenosyltransferase
MNRRKAKRICDAMKRSTVAVVGDIMLDRYLWGQVERISPEAPVPVVAVERTDVRPGGAANVAWNLFALGSSVRLVGLLGRDKQAGEIKSIIGDTGISTEYLVTDSRRVTTEKIRIVAHSQQVVRADFETGEPVEGRTLRRLLEAVGRGVSDADAVVVSDYGKGVVSAPVMDRLRVLSADGGTPVLVDPKEGHFSLYRGAYAVTPNKQEAGGFYHARIGTDGDLERVGRSLLRDLEARFVLITRGEEGMTLFREGHGPHHVPTSASEVYDVTGAGDTVISVLAAAVAAGAPITDAIELANAAAGIVIRELGTAAVTADELVAAFQP